MKIFHKHSLPLFDPDPADPAAPPAPTANWFDGLPEDLRVDPRIAPFKGKELTELVKKHVHVEKVLGTKRVAEPQADWKDEQWVEFYRAAGRPDAPERYTIPEYKDLPEEMKFDPEKIKAFSAKAHALGFNQRQLQGVLDFYTEGLKSDVEGAKNQDALAISKGETALREKWGDKYEHNVVVANAALKKFGSPEFITWLNTKELSNHPDMASTFFEIGRAMMEDSAQGRGSGLPLPPQSQAIAEIEQLKGDAEFQKAIFDRNHPSHRAALERQSRLYQVAYPNRQPVGA